jgi:hypothetical protein
LKNYSLSSFTRLRRSPSLGLLLGLLVAAPALSITASPLPKCVTTNACNKWAPCEIDLTLSSSSAVTNQAFYALRPKLTVNRLNTLGQVVESKDVEAFYYERVNSTSGAFKVRFNPSDMGDHNFTISNTGSYTVTSDASTFHCNSSSNAGFLRDDPSYPRSFVWDNGTHPYLWGQTYYQMVNQARKSLDTPSGDSFWHPAVTGSASYGMNKIRLLVTPWGPDLRTGVNVTTRAFPLVGASLDRDQIDEKHWQGLDKAIDYLNSQGIVADLILFHDGDATWTPFGTTAQNQRYTRYVTARYAAYPNVIWSLANEYQLLTGSSPAGNGPWNDLGCLIRGCSPYTTPADPWIANGSSLRALSIHNNINTTNVSRPINGSYPCFEFFSNGWATHTSLQTKRTTPFDCQLANIVARNRGLSARSCSSGTDALCPGSNTTLQPVFDDEYGYIGSLSTNATTDRTLNRQAIWGVAMGGGFGSAGSVNGPTDTTGCGGTCEPTFYTNWIVEPAYTDIKALTSFFGTQVANWWRLVPDSAIPGQANGYALSDPGSRFVAYAAAGPNLILNVPTPPSGHQWSYCFIDPQSGICSDKVLRLAGGGTQTFSLPSSADWAMLFQVY